MHRNFQLFALTAFAIVFAFPAGSLNATPLPQAAKQLTHKPEAPEGWAEDERFLLLGKEAYRSKGGEMFAVVDRLPAPEGSHKEWFKEYIKGKLSRYKLQNIQGPIAIVDDKKRPVEGAYMAIAVAKTNKGETVIVAFAALIQKKEAQAWKMFWDKAHSQKNSQLTANACSFLAAGGRKTPLPKAKDLDQIMATLRKKKDSAKTKAQKSKAQKTDDTSQPFVAEPGKGVSADKLRGVIFDFGKSRTKQVWVNDMPMRIPTWTGACVYVVFNDGWAYRSPSVAPADLDVEASRRAEPKKWVRWDDVKINTPTAMMKPLAKGTRIEISVQRPSTRSSSSTSVSTNWRSLKLTSKGRFETGSTTLSSKQTGIDSLMGPSSNSVFSSNKDGSFTSVSGSYVAGGGMLKTQSAKRKPGTKGNHSGTYLIDGNTIELRYDNGTIARAVFGFDGEDEIIFGRTNYWVPKKTKKSK